MIIRYMYFLMLIILLMSTGACKKKILNENKITIQKTVPDSSIIATYSFDSDLGNWYEKSECCSWSGVLEKDIVRSGSSSLKVELRKNDVLYGHRSELGMQPSNLNQDGWYKFSLYFPQSFVKDPVEESIVQWQALPDFALGETWRSAPMFLGVLNDRFILDIKTDAKPVTVQGDYAFTRLDLGPVEKAIWSDWVFHIIWAYDKTGIIEIWKDKTQIVKRINLPNAYNDKMFPYFKIGIYKWGWADGNSSNELRTIYVDEIKIGNKTSSFEKISK